jgi:hypothetical protein
MPSLPTSQEKAIAIKRAYEKILLAKANVVGVGVGFRFAKGQRIDTIGLVVMVTRKVPASQLRPEEVIPTELEGVPVDVQEVGPLSAQPK